MQIFDNLDLAKLCWLGGDLIFTRHILGKKKNGELSVFELTAVRILNINLYQVGLLLFKRPPNFFSLIK